MASIAEIRTFDLESQVVESFVSVTAAASDEFSFFVVFVLSCEMFFRFLLVTILSKSFNFADLIVAL